MTLVKDPTRKTFGYIMPLLEPRFQGLEHLVLGKMKPAPSFEFFVRQPFLSQDAFEKLHNMGACYKDINLGGPFLDPLTGEVRICDTDNVRVNKPLANIIFVYFAAPNSFSMKALVKPTQTFIHWLSCCSTCLFDTIP